MKKIAALLTCCLTLTLSTPTFALDWTDLINYVAQMYNIDLKIDELNEQEVAGINSVLAALTGTHSYGSQYYDSERYLWGKNAGNWQEILALSHEGGGDGALGQSMKLLANDFPIKNDFNSLNIVERDYYRLQAQTSLISRSAAQLAYKQAVNQEHTMQSLHELIDKTADEKSASDLNNRLTSEQVMTNVQQTKLLSVLVEQQAVRAQEQANRAKEDMEFFNAK